MRIDPITRVRPAVHRRVFLRALTGLALTAVLPPRLRASSPARPADATETRSLAGRLIPSPEPDWPQWRGPRRDGLCDETGLLPAWPAKGPPLLWKIRSLGRGYSAPIIVRNRLYLAGEFEDALHVLAFDLNGQLLWRAPNGQAWRGPYPGARACCVYGQGKIYHQNAHGRVACFDADSGRELWAVNVLERFGAKNITWAISECLLLDGPRLLVTPGGPQTLMAALDARTGQTVWTSAPLLFTPASSGSSSSPDHPARTADHASYASPILFALHGRRHLVHCAQRHAFGVDADTGRLLWSQPLPTRYQVLAMTPVLCGDAVFVTGPDTPEGGKLFRLRPEGDDVRADQVWTTPLDTCHGGVVRVGTSLFGSWYRARKGWACIEVETGRVRYQTQDLPMGSVLYAEGRLYCLSQTGTMALLKPTEQAFEFMGQFPLVSERENDVWAHPVIHQRRLYLRHHEELSCFDLQDRR